MGYLVLRTRRKARLPGWEVVNSLSGTQKNCMKINEHIEKLTAKLLAGNISREELKVLNNWYDSQDINEVPEEVAYHKEMIRMRMLARLQGEIRKDQPLYKQAADRLWKGRKVVAAVLVLLVTSILAWNNRDLIALWLNPVEYAKFNTPANQRKSITLPDGTKVRLNAGSELIYSNRFNKSIREVFLSGEAFFDVTRNEQKPFIIHSNQITTTVLGTSFNIRSYENQPEQVTVATGKVKVELSAPTNKTPADLSVEALAKTDEFAVVLTKEGQATYNPTTRKFTQKEVDIDIHLAWKEPQLIFSEILFSKAVAMLENRYGVNITLKNEKLGNCIIIGEHHNESLENVLKALQFTLEFDYQFKTGKAIEITGKGCH